MRQISIFLFLVIIIGVFPANLSSQQLDVKNVRFESNGKIVKIHYGLIGEPGKQYKISLLLSDDKGYSYKIRPKTMTGDIGKNITAGENKEIQWYLFRDFPDGLSGKNFVFAVDAKIQKGKKWPYYVIGTGVAAGAAILYLSQKQKEETPTTGSIIIDIPN